MILKQQNYFHKIQLIDFYSCNFVSLILESNKHLLLSKCYPPKYARYQHKQPSSNYHSFIDDQQVPVDCLLIGICNDNNLDNQGINEKINGKESNKTSVQINPSINQKQSDYQDEVSFLGGNFQQSNEAQQCFVQTSSLDGEKNLKPKTPVKFISNNLNSIFTNEQNQNISIEYEPPTKNLYEFNCLIRLNNSEKQISKLDLNQFIHSGSVLKNSGKVLALVLYTGKDTKIIMNQGKYIYKQSILERQHNIILMINLAIILSVSAIMSGRLFKFIEDNGKKMKYVFPEENPDAKYWALNGMGSFYILMKTLIPLSMVICLEIAKLGYSFFMIFDVEMMSPSKDNSLQGCKIQNLTLIEELGNINYMLCDKTGTLTQNELIFKSFATCGQVYSVDQDDHINLTDNLQNDQIFQDYWRCICICHNVIQLKKGNENQLSGSSQDELILLQMAEKSNYAKFLSKKIDSIQIELNNHIEQFSIIKTFEFTSDRKMMSIIVKDLKSKRYVLFCKGADSSIIPKLQSCSKIDQETLNSLENFSQKGYRTLVFAKRELDEQQVEQILNDTLSLDQIEDQLTLLGVSGVEDTLQENVKECINDFQEANIKVWMLTGDKGETALQIGFSCGLASKNNKILKIDNLTDLETLYQKNQGSQIQTKTFNDLLISGSTIQLCFNDQTNQNKLLQLLKLSKSVIIYRCSPAQKAEIVKFVKTKIKGSVTLAIGDGANDVNMIQQAHVGIGIFGKEGNQAAQFSDYAIPKFKDLRRLMFWHGRSFGVKFSNFVKWFIYKNSLHAITLLYFNLENGFSGTSIMSDLFYSLYDVSMNTIAVTNYTMCDQDVDFKKTNKEETLGFKLSHYYQHCREKVLQTTLKYYLIWLLYVFISCVPIYFLSQYSYYFAIVSKDGKTEGLWASGLISITIMTTAHHLMLAIGTKNWSIYMSFYLISFMIFMPIMILAENFRSKSQLYQIAFSDIMNQPQYWLASILGIAVITLPYYVVHVIWFTILYPKFNQ
eukprot:403342344